ncbi:MAG: hypothetical protein WA705_25990 [Candidatus Ozemobacteraceae bacterium]
MINTRFPEGRGGANWNGSGATEIISNNPLGRDSYRSWLWVFLVIGLLGTLVMSPRIRDTWFVVRMIREVVAEDKAKSGDSIMVGGLVLPAATEPSDISICGNQRHSELVANLSFLERMATKNMLYIQMLWSGGNNDTEDIISRNFLVKSDRATYLVGRNPFRAVPRTNTEFYYHHLFHKYAPKSNYLTLKYLDCSEITVVGRYELDAKGKKTIVGTPGQPLLLLGGSSVVFVDVYGALAMELLAVAMAIVCVVLPIPASVKSKFQRNPARYFAFDLIGGPETLALTLALAWFGFGGLAFWWWGGEESFRIDLLFAAALAGFLTLIRFGRNVEYFLVADKEDQYFYEVSRGFLLTSKRRLGRMDRAIFLVKPHIDDGVDRKGQTFDIILAIDEVKVVVSKGWWSFDAANTALIPYRTFAK